MASQAQSNESPLHSYANEAPAKMMYDGSNPELGLKVGGCSRVADKQGIHLGLNRIADRRRTGTLKGNGGYCDCGANE
jgi:hypothetical protein